MALSISGAWPVSEKVSRHLRVVEVDLAHRSLLLPHAFGHIAPEAAVTVDEVDGTQSQGRKEVSSTTKNVEYVKTSPKR